MPSPRRSRRRSSALRTDAEASVLSRHPSPGAHNSSNPGFQGRGSRQRSTVWRSYAQGTDGEEAHLDDWQERVDAVWADETLTDDDRITRIDALAAERAPADAVALFERAGARDSAGYGEDAEPLYREALDRGLDPHRRTRAVIQWASTIRNLGKTDEALALLEAEYGRSRGEDLADEASAFYALALASSGRPQEGLAVALQALAPHLSRYTRSVTGYAQRLVDEHP